MKRFLFGLLLLMVGGLVAPGATPSPRPPLRLPLILKDSPRHYYLPQVVWPPLVGGGQGAALPPRPPTMVPTATPPPAPRANALPCGNLVHREGEGLLLNGQPFVFAGANATSLMDPGLAEREIPKVLDGLAGWGATMVRIWVQPGADLDRFARILDLAGPRGLRFVVTLQDYYYYKSTSWFTTTYKQVDLPHIERVVSRFRARPEVAIWEVMNEPWCGEDAVADPDCFRILQAWAADTTGLIRRLDPCRPISLGTSGVRHTPLEAEAFRRLHTLDTVDIVSIHRVPQDWYRNPVELDIAHELGKPIMLGEVYELGYNKDGSQLGGDVIGKRADKLGKDMAKALELGVDGYLLWDYTPGAVLDSEGKPRYFYDVYGYEAGDPIGPVMRNLPIPRLPIW